MLISNILLEFKSNIFNFLKFTFSKIFISIISLKLKSNIFNNLKFNLNLSISNDEYIPNTSQLSITDNKYNQQMVDFKNLLDEEFQKFFKFFQKIKIQLHNKLNRHLYTQTNYSTYTEEEVQALL